ncbi:MAG: putative sulfate exporter family transporter [Phycisphaerae bacterium]
MTASGIFYLLLLVTCLSTLVPPPLALAIGVVTALAGLARFPEASRRGSRLVMQTCIVLLGLRIDLGQLWREASSGFAFAAATIVGAFVVAFGLGRLLGIGREQTLLVSSGTAICGGSAIAAVGSAIQASTTSMAVATGAIFILNAVALNVFPLLGHALGLTDTQYGTWVGVAVHDMASVAGAGAAYGTSAALDTAMVVKLSRVVWILPCTVFAVWMTGTPATGGPATAWRRAAQPFLIGFLLASVARTLVPALAGCEAIIKKVATGGFGGAIFLIGAGLSVAAVRSVGWRVLVQATVTWVTLAAASLMAIMWWKG